MKFSGIYKNIVRFLANVLCDAAAVILSSYKYSFQICLDAICKCNFLSNAKWKQEILAALPSRGIFFILCHIITKIDAINMNYWISIKTEIVFCVMCVCTYVCMHECKVYRQSKQKKNKCG